MQDNIIKLNIQLLSETPAVGDTLSLDTEMLGQAVESLNAIGSALMTSLETVSKTATDLYTNGGFDSIVGQDLNTIMNETKTYFSNFETTVKTLSTFLSGVINAFVASDEKMAKEINNWGTSISSVLTSLGSSIVAKDVAKGSYSTETFMTNTIDRGVKISEASRTITTETFGILSDSMKYLKSSTGYSALDWGSAIGNEAIGTAKTLFGFAGENAGSSIITNLWNTLGDGLGNFLGQK